MGSSGADGLPVDIWGSILSYIYPYCAGSGCVAKFALVCRTFNKVWKRFTFNDWLKGAVISYDLKKLLAKGDAHVIQMLTYNVKYLYRTTFEPSPRQVSPTISPAQIAVFLYTACYEMCCYPPSSESAKRRKKELLRAGARLA